MINYKILVKEYTLTLEGDFKNIDDLLNLIKQGGNKDDTKQDN